MTTTRRTFMGGAAALPSLSLISATAPAMAAGETDIELQQLGRQLDIAAAEHRAAVDAKEWIVAEWKHRWPLAPDEITLHWRPGMYGHLEKGMDGVCLARAGEKEARIVRDIEDLELMLGYAHEGMKRRSRAKSEKTRARDLASRKAYLAKRKRHLALGKKYYAEIERIREASGLIDAERREDEATQQVYNLVGAIMALDAASAVGVQVKARAVRAWWNSAISGAPENNCFCWGTLLADNILALGTGADGHAVG